MRSKECQIKISSLECTLLPKLEGKLFHVTSRQSFKRINKDGYIKANVTNVPKWYTPKKSYASSRNLICLFDFRHASKEEILNAQDKTNFLNPDHCEEKPIYIFFGEAIVPELIPWTKAKDEVGYKEQWVPFVETWYLSPLSVKNINHVLEVNIILDKITKRRNHLIKEIG